MTRKVIDISVRMNTIYESMFVFSKEIIGHYGIDYIQQCRPSCDDELWNLYLDLPHNKDIDLRARFPYHPFGSVTEIWSSVFGLILIDATSKEMHGRSLVVTQE